MPLGWPGPQMTTFVAGLDPGGLEVRDGLCVCAVYGREDKIEGGDILKN